MLARFRTTATRAANFDASRLSAVTGRPCRAAVRAFHHATGEFTKLGPEGTFVTEEVSIRVGDPGEAYVCIPTQVGYALQASGCAAHTKSPDRLAITYFHDTQHFAFDSSPDCPRVVVPQQLPRQSAANSSPATLYLFGLIHTIALDGTKDATFTEIASTIIPEIGRTLDRLKDM